jgi:hypothetical protein
MKPLMQQEVDVAITKGEKVADDAVDEMSIRAAMLGGAIITAIAGAAWWVGRSKRR